MATNKTFYTDSSGRDFIKRVLQHLTLTFIYFISQQSISVVLCIYSSLEMILLMIPVLV